MKSIVVFTLLLGVVPLLESASQPVLKPPTVWGDDEVLARRHLDTSARPRFLAAATFLRDQLVARNVYSHIPGRCLAFELEDIEGEQYSFAAKVDQSICGPPSASNLLDRYRVDMKKKIIYLYDAANDSFSALPGSHRATSRRGGK